MKQSTPRHIGIIPDGTRRWSRNNATNLDEGYALTMSRLRDVIASVFDNGVEVLSVYLLSLDNLSRSPDDLDPVIRQESIFLEHFIPEIVQRYSAVIHIVGRLDPLPDPLRLIAKRTRAASQHEGLRKLNLLIGYNPLDELLSAVARTGTEHFDLAALSVPESVDLVIRTGNDQRMSGFLPLQSMYAELVFLPTTFNDTLVSKFVDEIRHFGERERRFGT